MAKKLSNVLGKRRKIVTMLRFHYFVRTIKHGSLIFQWVMHVLFCVFWYRKWRFLKATIKIIRPSRIQGDAVQFCCWQPKGKIGPKSDPDRDLGFSRKLQGIQGERAPNFQAGERRTLIEVTVNGSHRWYRGTFLEINFESPPLVSNIYPMWMPFIRVAKRILKWLCLLSKSFEKGNSVFATNYRYYLRTRFFIII